MARKITCAAMFLSTLVLLIENSDSVTLDTANTIRWSANLRPWKLRDRRFGGDRFARGLFEYSFEKLSNGSYTAGLRLDIKNVKSGGKFPILGLYKGTPQQTVEQAKALPAGPFPMMNATRGGRFNKRLKRYTYLLAFPVGITSKSSFDSGVKPILKEASGYFVAILDQNNRTMIRGQCQLELK
eukprot:TRINITY_DN18613_c0_g1_i2.p1 TRINITY_DN18613_c0_g1~~TRINITY_DN18613_c0_g1_i2.p1  ORF type:complete len:184 (+),score=2.06 TRINITY_DN18613_c0_g1_i2:159-710(+)